MKEAAYGQAHHGEAEEGIEVYVIHTYIHTSVAILAQVRGSRWHPLIEVHLVRNPIAPRVH